MFRLEIGSGSGFVVSWTNSAASLGDCIILYPNVADWLPLLEMIHRDWSYGLWICRGLFEIPAGLI